jgi:hypothetical protein
MPFNRLTAVGLAALVVAPALTARAQTTPPPVEGRIDMPDNSKVPLGFNSAKNCVGFGIDLTEPDFDGILSMQCADPESGTGYVVKTGQIAAIKMSAPAQPQTKPVQVTWTQGFFVVDAPVLGRFPTEENCTDWGKAISRNGAAQVNCLTPGGWRIVISGGNEVARSNFRQKAPSRLPSP